MTQIFVSLGSNIEAKENLSKALHCLHRRYGPLILSPVYESLSVGFAGDNFLNMVAAYDSKETVQQAAASLKDFEQQLGRKKESKGFKSRNIDLDLILYGDEVIETENIQLPRDEIRRYAFVLRPLADIYSQGLDPLSQKTYAQLWAEFDDAEQKLWPMEITFPSEIKSEVSL